MDLMLKGGKENVVGASKKGNKEGKKGWYYK
jgi:hypothetical protein